MRHGGPGQHRDVRAATLIERVQATHGMDPAPEGDRARNIVSPRFEGGLASNLILYDEETVPPELGPQPPMRISLCASSQDHWTIALDTVFPSTLEEHRRIREQAASQPTEAGALPSSSSSTGDGGTEAAPTKERTLQMANSILDQVHALRLRSMRDLGVLGTWTGH